jgi:hypothetical protein
VDAVCYALVSLISKAVAQSDAAPPTEVESAMSPLLIFHALVGALTCYLVASGCVAGRRKRFEDVQILNAALGAVALAVGALLLKFGIEARAIAVSSAALDLRVIIRGIDGKQRIARHLWRMNVALAIGMISVTPRLNRLAGHPIQSDAVLAAPTLLVLFFMVFWLWRVLASKRVVIFTRDR